MDDAEVAATNLSMKMSLEVLHLKTLESEQTVCATEVRQKKTPRNPTSEVASVFVNCSVADVLHRMKVEAGFCNRWVRSKRSVCCEVKRSPASPRSSTILETRATALPGLKTRMT